MNPPDLEPRDELPLLVLTRRARRRLLGAALTLAGLLALPYVVPPLGSVRPWRPGAGYTPFWNITARPSMAEQRKEQEQLADFEKIAVAAEEDEPAEPATGEPEPVNPRPAAVVPSPEPAPAEPAAPPPGRLFPEYSAHPDDAEKLTQRIENPEALEHYFGQLTLTDLDVPGAVTRAGQWGDSVLGGDGLTFALRKRLQERFGDAGHGFHALSKYSIGYGHRGVRFQDKGNWRSCEIIFKCRPDQRYGYAGVHSGSSSGGLSTWQTAKVAPGDKVSRFELWYSKSPDGGRFQVKIDGAEASLVDTKADEVGDAVEVFQVPDGPHSFEVRAAGGGASRGFGVVLERDVPGVVWDELSLIGSFTQRLDYQKADHLGWQLRRRGIDLMVFMFGGNDVQREFDDLKTEMRPYEEEYSRVIQKFKRGRPEASCMIMSLIDHGVRGEDGVRTRGIVPRLVSSQRKVATEAGCAFFDTFHAMGGMNSIARWLRARPQLAAPDFAHPTLAGQGVIATLVYRALMHEYSEYRKRHTGLPLPELDGHGETAADGYGRPEAEPIAADAGAAPSR
jgi:lysophospholipase L1-like esterase